MQTIETSTFKIPEYAFHSLPMSVQWRLHELANLIDTKSQLRSGDGYVLQAPHNISVEAWIFKGRALSRREL